MRSKKSSTKHLRPPGIRVLLRRLRKRLPLKAPLRVRQSVGVKNDGDWVLGTAAYKQKWLGGRKKGKPQWFVITVDSRLPPGEKWECVVHEYAHCLDRGTRWNRPKDCHDTRWGQCYSRVFRASFA